MIELAVIALVGLFTIALVISIAAERLRIPAAAALVGVGAMIQSTFHARIPFHFGPALLYVFLPPLIFEAAWNLHLDSLAKNAQRIACLALPGTIATAGIIGLILGMTHVVSWPIAFLFGSIVSATDPVAVVGIFRRVNIPIDVKTIIEGESLANDGVAVALFTVALALSVPHAFQPEMFSFGNLVVMPLFSLWGGSIIGATIALPVCLALRATRASEYEVAATVSLAYLSYLVASYFHLSGIFATAASAITLRGLLSSRNFLSHRDDVDVFWNAGAAITNTVLFFATGLLIDPVALTHNPLIVIATVCGLIASRAIIAVCSLCEAKTRAVLFLAGMRGALPIALALSLPEAVPSRDLIFDGVAASVILTIVIQGAPLEPMLRWIYRSTPKSLT